MNNWIDLHALWRIVAVGVVAGAGLPALFAVGLRALATSPDGEQKLSADSTRVVGGNPLGLAVAIVCFAAVVGAVAWGVYLIVQGT